MSAQTDASPDAFQDASPDASRGRDSHPTPSTTTSSRTDAQTREAAKAAAMTVHARVSSIDPWDALTRVLSLLRPDWRPEAIRGALLDDKRPPRDVVAAAIACALDADVRHPGAIAHRTTGTATPTPPNLRRDDLCPVHLDDAATCRGCAADRKARREETT